jgi:hypothetical protein
MFLVAIDKNTHEVVPSEEKLKFESGSLHELQDDLPDNAPRFVLLSYEVYHPFGLGWD